MHLIQTRQEGVTKSLTSGEESKEDVEVLLKHLYGVPALPWEAGSELQPARVYNMAESQGLPIMKDEALDLLGQALHLVSIDLAMLAMPSGSRDREFIRSMNHATLRNESWLTNGGSQKAFATLVHGVFGGIIIPDWGMRDVVVAFARNHRGVLRLGENQGEMLDLLSHYPDLAEEAVSRQ